MELLGLTVIVLGIVAVVANLVDRLRGPRSD